MISYMVCLADREFRCHSYRRHVSYLQTRQGLLRMYRLKPFHQNPVCINLSHSIIPAIHPSQTFRTTPHNLLKISVFTNPAFINYCHSTTHRVRALHFHRQPLSFLQTTNSPAAPINHLFNLLFFQ